MKRLLLGGTALSCPTAAYAYAIEPDQVRLAEVDVKIPGLPRAAHGLRIGHIGDTHCDSPRALARAEHAARLLADQKPDLVVLTGDYITHDARQRMHAAAEVLRPLTTAPLGAYAVLGNHDWWAGDPDYVESELRRIGCTVLRNRSVQVAGLWLVGLEQRCDSRQDPALALRGVPADSVKLLLIHEPDYADEAPPGFSLQFSGHSHGGQVRIPGLPPIIVPTHSRRYPEGLRQAKNHLVYTTRGVGMVGLKFRFCCRPEVAVIRLIAG